MMETNTRTKDFELNDIESNSNVNNSIFKGNKNDNEIDQDNSQERSILIPRSNTTASSTQIRRRGGTDQNDGIGNKKKRLRRRRENEAEYNSFLKYFSLFLLIAQVVGMVLLMRYSRTHVSQGSTDLYLSSTAVFNMEVLKFIVCNFVVLHQSRYNVKLYIDEFHSKIVAMPVEVGKVSVPSFLYVIQNNLLYYALSNLDAATYQVCYQLKILTTALFSATMLKRQFSKMKWSSLVILTIGVAIVQTSGETHDDAKNATDNQKNLIVQNRSLGLVAILCAAITSGFSGVYFEKILKGSNISLWIRNIQMGIPSIIIAFVTCYIQDGSIISEKGFFVGYNTVVWFVIVIQAIGGLIVAVVVKYADNVLKTFATSISIVVSCIISAIFFDFHANLWFMIGSSFVLISTVMYSKPERTKRLVGTRRIKRNEKDDEGNNILPITNKSTSVVI